jgi:hypothetical protein
LTEIAVPLHPHLPRRTERHLRRGHDVARQIVILNALDGLVNDTDPKFLKKWLKDQGIWDQMEEKDHQYFKGNISKEMLSELSWKSESLFTLAWTCGLAAEVPPPSREVVSELKPIYDKIPPEVEVDAFVSGTELIAVKTIVEELDFYYCLDAAVRHPELWKSPADIGCLNHGAILERRHALEWIADPKTAWHHVTLDT